MTNKITIKELIQRAIDEKLIDAETGSSLVKELVSLESDSDFLNRLQAAGVDNWEGYEYA